MELKDIIEAGLKKTSEKLDSAIAAFEGQVKDNGKADCAGNVAKPGNTVTQFVQFDASGSVFIMCADESLDACIGPFRRMHGQET